MRKPTKKGKKSYYDSLNIKDITCNKKFWSIVKPLFSDKGYQNKKIILIGDTIISNDATVAETMNNYFTNAIKELQINEFITEVVPDENMDDIGRTILKFNKHPSIIKIRENMNTNDSFSFSNTSLNNIESKITNLNINKPTTSNNIPAKILVGYKDIYSKFIVTFYNNCIFESSFPDTMKMADITPAHTKDDKTDKRNYRPVSILPSISKIFERIIYEDIFQYMGNKFSPYLCGFRKGYSTQHCLIIMLEKWKKALDKHNIAGALLTDLSKAFDSINHDLLIAKLAAYGFALSSLKLVASYLSDRKQRTKVNNSFSKWSEITSGVPQGSILGPLLFNIYIYINDIFYFVDEDNITNYADDTTPYSIDTNVETVISNLEIDSSILLMWFENNLFKLNADKCKLLITNHDAEITIKVGCETIIGQKSVKLLGIKLDNKLDFNDHITNICKKANSKLHALARVSNLMNKDKLRILMKAFIESQFPYCPLVWMFHSRTLNNKINKLHERALRLVYKGDKLTFQQLLNMDNSVSIHHRNLQKLAIEIFKVKNNLSPGFMNTLFPLSHNPYNLRSNPIFKTEIIRTVTYGSETISFRGPQTWALVPSHIKSSNTLQEFKAKIK